MRNLSRRDFVWGVLFGGAFLARTALDWFVPTQDLSVRSSILTYVAGGLLLANGFWAAWLSGSSRSGTFSAAATAFVGAMISMGGAAAILAVFHDEQTLANIERTGGVYEAFILPVIMVIPALILGTLGGGLGAAAHAKQRIDPI